MKIALLSPFYPYRGGIAQFSGRLYKALEEENEVKAFSFLRLYPDFLFPGKTQYTNDKENTTDVPTERILDSLNPFSYEKTVRAIEKFQPDILLVAYWMSFFVPAYGYIVSRLRKKTKIIILVHNAIPHEPRFFDKALAKLLFNRSDGFIVMSRTVEKDLLALSPEAPRLLKPHPLYDHFGEKIEQTEALKALGINLNKKTLLFFGLIRDYKGLDLLIDAMALLDSSYQLLIAGETYGSFDKYQKQLDVSPAKDRIYLFNRYIDDSEVSLLFSAADLLVLPYKSATQSGIIPVAYHFELPVVATDIGGLREMIEPAGTGIITLPESAAIAKGVEQIFSSDISIFTNNIKKEKQNLNWETFAHSLTAFAEKITSERIR
ncbi:MAG: glycosyltransferase [Candidatus Azobacteroides sp.]|nr:glycosyltransferase [Candidatus Azobacteroides sp.]